MKNIPKKGDATMAMTMLVLLMILNFAISWFNAWAVGKAWVETKAVGGAARFMAWMGATMSACGFTWVYLVVIGLIAGATGKLPQRYLEAFFSLGYLIIIGPILGSGLAITINSWAYFWRRRSFGSGAVAGWNTFAQIYNTYQAVSAVPAALKNVKDVLGGDSDSDSAKSKLAMLVVALVICAAIGGILTTTAIIRVTARDHSLAVREKYATT